MKNPCRNKNSSPELLEDYSRMQQKPLRSPVHWLYVLLLMSASGCALWQHGHTWFTLGVIAAVPFFASLVYVPYKYYNSLMRSIVNGLFSGLVIAWACWRIQTELPDKVLVESLSAMCLIFLTTGKSRDYGYLFFSSIFLMIYGALVPRMAYLYIGIPGIILLLLLLWERRNASLAATEVHRILPRKIKRTIPFILFQLVLTVILFWFILPLMPLRNNELPGFFETSFTTERDSALPPELQKWIMPKKVKASSDPKAKATTEQGKQTPQAAGDKGTPMDIKNSQSKSLIDGNGSSVQGTDLLFYVKTPVKIYHTVRLYDYYDGRTWKVSNTLRRVRLSNAFDKSAVHHDFDMKYTMLKLSSKNLPFGFMPLSFFAVNEDLRKSYIAPHTYGAEVRGSPELPFEYNVSVQMNILSMDKIRNDLIKPTEKGKKISDPLWQERINPAHYKTLPRKRISKRIMQLAKDLTKESRTYYEKAVTLRDYLRNTYPYTLNAQPVPQGKEAADYFLFELKTGHCEYFACALAVLARAAGLPARVATGYSPGNFNTLNNMFEVYEYHAHAWTQIYIPHAGWLTMDATPPSSIPSETLPKGLGYLRDPFGDEWKITPPEMTENTNEFLKQDLEKNLLKRKTELGTLDSALVNIVNKQEEIKQEVNEKYSETKTKIKKSGKKGGLLYKLKQIFNRCSASFTKLYFGIVDFVFSAWLLLVSGILFVIVFCKFAKTAFFEIKRHLMYKKMLHLAAHAGSVLETDSRLAILEYYHAFASALQYTGLTRPQTRGLLDFSDDLGRISQTLGNNARGLFMLYYKAKYREDGVTAEEAASASAYYQEAQKKLFELRKAL